MASINPPQASPDVIAHTKQLATGKFLAYIEHRTGGCTAQETESFVAGVFDNAGAANAAALRLMQTFQSSVIAHCGE